MGRLWELVEGLDAGQAVPTSKGLAGYQDPLADLLATPIRHLTAPLAVASSVLAETIYLVADDRQAATVRATGGIPYTPQEIDILWELHQAVPPAVWAQRLKLIHEAKRRFDATVARET